MSVAQFVKWEERGVEQGAESEGLPDAVEEAQEVLQSLVDRMVETSLEDFELVGEEADGGETMLCLATLG